MEGRKQGARRFDVTRRFNFLLMNVFRGHFLRGEAQARRRAYGLAAKRLRVRPLLLTRQEELRQGRRLIGVHKRVDNPGTARMQLEQRLLVTESYVRAAERLLARPRGSSEGPGPFTGTVSSTGSSWPRTMRRR